MVKSILDQVVSEIKDHPVEAVMAAGLLVAIVGHKIYKNERKYDPTLACFLDHVSAQKQQPVSIAQVVKRVEKCQGKKMNGEQVRKTVRILQGSGGIMRDNQERIWLTRVGTFAKKTSVFRPYHEHSKMKQIAT